MVSWITTVGGVDFVLQTSDKVEWFSNGRDSARDFDMGKRDGWTVS